MNPLFIITPLYIIGEIARYQNFLRKQHRIEMRILVNGSRGKSSVTRLISGALREKYEGVFAKTTGTYPYLIYPDGSEEPIIRKGKPNISEQVWIMNYISGKGCRIFVSECMAISPEMIETFEKKIMQSHIGIITNVRPDHLDTMGSSLSDIARSLSLSIPFNGKLFINKGIKYRNVFEEMAKRRHTEIIYADELIKENEMDKFSYIEHKENVSLALSVALSLGVKREEALRGMYKAKPDPGVLKKYILKLSEKRIYFYNAFAANDPESTRILWESIQKVGKSVIVFYARQDRTSRSKSFVPFLSKIPFDWIIITGPSTRAFISRLISSGVDRKKIIDMENRDALHICESIIEIEGKELTVVGMGNIVGIGGDIVRYFASRGKNAST